MMSRLPMIICPLCGRQIDSAEFPPNKRGGAPTAKHYDDCLRRCVRCRLAFSNANHSDVTRLSKIDRAVPRWIPKDVLRGWEQALTQAVNEINRPTKHDKFLFWNSEDRTTWAVFRFLQMRKMLRDTAAGMGIDWVAKTRTEPTLLLWGAPVPTTPKAVKLREYLEAVLDEIGETPRCRSEPDVILDFGRVGLVLVECKLDARNKDETKHPNWNTYLSHRAFSNPKGVRESGLYQLARNWRIAWQLADRLNRQQVALVNLGPARLFQGDADYMLGKFERSLRPNPARLFHRATWSDLRSSAGAWQPVWLQRFL